MTSTFQSPKTASLLGLWILTACAPTEAEGPWLVTRPAAAGRASFGNVSRPVSTEQRLQGPLAPAPGAFAEWEVGSGQGWSARRIPLDQEGGATSVELDSDPEAIRSAARLYTRRDTAERFSVVWIVLDTVRADYLGCYGHDRPTSPRIDALAREGLVFERAVSPASWTLPAVASMLTGLYAESHGVLHTEHKLGPGALSFVEVLAGAGYTTGAVVSGTFTDSFWGFDQGFDEYDDLGMVVDDAVGGSTEIAAMEARAHRRVTSPEVTGRALDFLERNQDRRFFLLAHYFDPHQDFVEHAGFSERFGPRPAADGRFGRYDPDPAATARLRGLYEGEIAFTDHHIGRLLERLSDAPFAENVVVVITADHGEEFYERQWLGHGNTLFNELVRVPLVISVPGVAARRVTDPVTTVDLAPTLLELCGLGSEFGQGESLVRLFEAAGPARAVYTSLFPSLAAEDGQLAVQTAFRVDRDDRAAIRDERLVGDVGELLFEWPADPLQLKNLGSQASALPRALLELYERERPRLIELRTSSERLELSPEILKALRGLGYAGEDGDR
jgi:choline-sulfatase